jgi:hypothetical protein
VPEKPKKRPRGRPRRVEAEPDAAGLYRGDLQGLQLEFAVFCFSCIPQCSKLKIERWDWLDQMRCDFVVYFYIQKNLVHPTISWASNLRSFLTISNNKEWTTTLKKILVFIDRELLITEVGWTRFFCILQRKKLYIFQYIELLFGVLGAIYQRLRPLVRWSVGQLVCWSVGPLVCLSTPILLTFKSG